MKTKKAFSLVELVVVIAVIAILAGVTITIMTSSLGKTKDNSDLIELKSRISEIKNNDLVDQKYDKNWLTLIDCENNIAEDIANTIGSTIGIQNSISKYVDKSEQNKTNITPDILDVLIKNSFNDPILGGVTEDQIKSIVSVIFNDRNVEDKTTIKNKAITHMYDKGYTAYDVAKVLNENKDRIDSYDFSNITKNTNIVIPEYSLVKIGHNETGTAILNYDGLLEACENGGEYYLTCDIDIGPIKLELKKDLTIHGNNHCISGDDTRVFLINVTDVSLSIDYLTINTSNNEGICIKNADSAQGATIVLNNCSFESKYIGLEIRNSVLNMNNCEIESKIGLHLHSTSNGNIKIEETNISATEIGIQLSAGCVDIINCNISSEYIINFASGINSVTIDKYNYTYTSALYKEDKNATHTITYTNP